MRRCCIKILISLLLGLLLGCSKSFDTPDIPPVARSEVAQERPITLLAAGDMYLQAVDFPSLEELRVGLPAHDLFLVNLESPITEHRLPISEEKSALHQSPHAVARLLKDFGVDLVGLGNNHILDYGEKGLEDTLASLDAAGVAHFEAGFDLEEAASGHVVELAGLRIGFLAFMQRYPAYQYEYPFYATPTRAGVVLAARNFMMPAITRMREQVDTLVVSFHFGREYRDVNSKQLRMARLAVDLGADLVLGHHSHNLQGLEVYRGVPILYSLGNFVFPGAGRFESMDSPLWAHGWLASLCVDAGRVVQVDLLPVKGNQTPGGSAPHFVGSDVLQGLREVVGQRFKLPLRISDRSLRWSATGQAACYSS